MEQNAPPERVSAAWAGVARALLDLTAELRLFGLVTEQVRRNVELVSARYDELEKAEREAKSSTKP